MSLRIRRVHAGVIDHPFRSVGAIISSLGRHEASRYVTVAVVAKDGCRGFGEAATAPTWSGETAETAVRIIEELLAPRLVGSTFDEPAEALAVMDAERMALPDRSFDVVVSQFVITAVPNPEATLDEFARVVRPGGEIVLVNHIGAESGPRALFEQGFAPIARRLGWRPEFRFGRLSGWAERHGGVRLLEHRPVTPLGHFSLIRFGKGPA